MTPIRSTLIALFAGFLAVTSCATPETGNSHPAPRAETQLPLLNSERIRQRFGSYGIEVVRESDAMRVSKLYSAEGGREVMRTLAVVLYPDVIPAPIIAEHREIKGGGSIGEVFKSHGWDVRKFNIYFGEFSASPEYAGVYAAMGGVRAADLAVHVYQLSVGKRGAWFPYARIAEVHQPDYLGLAQLRKIYGEAATGPDQMGIQATLDAVVSVMKSF